MAAGGRPARAQAPPDAASLDETLKALSRYQGGIDSAPMWRLRDHIAACRDEPAARAECERKLLAFLKTSPPPLARMAVCRQLRVIGSDAAVPVLQAMLKDERSADTAVYALQQIPGAAAESGLVQALQTAKGDTKIALIAALGQRKSQAAVPALAPLLQQPAFSRPAAVALGRIGGDSAASSLTAAYAGAPPDLKPVVAASLMTCAEAQLAAGDAAAALRLYEALLPDGSLPAPLRRAAAMGKILAVGRSAPNVVLEMLGGSDPILQEAAVARIKTAFGPDAIDPVPALLPRLPEATQAQVLAVLSGYPAERWSVRRCSGAWSTPPSRCGLPPSRPSDWSETRRLYRCSPGGQPASAAPSRWRHARRSAR